MKSRDSNTLNRIVEKTISEESLILCCNTPAFVDSNGFYAPQNGDDPNDSRYFMTDQYEVASFPDEEAKRFTLASIERVLALDNPSPMPDSRPTKEVARNYLEGPGMLRTIGFLGNSLRTVVDAYSFYVIDEDDELYDAVKTRLRQEAGIRNVWDNISEYFEGKKLFDAGYPSDRIENVLNTFCE